MKRMISPIHEKKYFDYYLKIFRQSHYTFVTPDGFCLIKDGKGSIVRISKTGMIQYAETEGDFELSGALRYSKKRVQEVVSCLKFDTDLTPYVSFLVGSLFHDLEECSVSHFQHSISFRNGDFKIYFSPKMEVESVLLRTSNFDVDEKKMRYYISLFDEYRYKYLCC